MQKFSPQKVAYQLVLVCLFLGPEYSPLLLLSYALVFSDSGITVRT